MSVVVSYKKQFTIMIILIVVLFGGVEIFAQVYDYYFHPNCNLVVNPIYKDVEYDLKKQSCDNFSDRVLYLDPITNITTFEPNQHYSTMNINSHGFRGSEISKDKPNDVYRIFVVGGSTTFAVRALTDMQTIPGYLQDYLHELNFNKKIEVVNAGIPGITSTDELNLIQKKIINFEPDLIIVYDGINDVKSAYGDTKPKIKTDILDNVKKRFFKFYKTPKVLGLSLSGIPEYFPNENNSITNPKEMKEGSKALLWEENMSAICALGNQNNFDTIIVLQPFLGTGNRSTTGYESVQINRMPEWWYTEYQYFADEIKNLNHTCDLAIDLRNVFDNVEERIYFDRMHISFKYNKQVAEKIAENSLPIIKNQI